MTFADVQDFLRGDQQAERAIPKRGFTAQLTTVTAAALAFLLVFVLAASLSASRAASLWASEFSDSASVRIAADIDNQEAVVETALTFLAQVPGIASARPLSIEEEQALLAPWLGSNVPIDLLPLPKLIEVTTEDGFDGATLGAQLTATVPGATLDDYGSWRGPLIAAAQRARLLAWIAVGLIGVVLVGLVTLAAQVSLTSNRQTIGVLRLVGATDSYIAQAFVRRFALRSVIGATIGTAIGLVAIRLLLTADVASSVGLPQPFPGFQALWLLGIPVLSGGAALLATQFVAQRALKEIP